MKEPRNARLEKFIKDGWRPSIHGEFLDLYNQRSRGLISGTIKARIDNSNSFILKPISGAILTEISSSNMHYVVHYHDQESKIEDNEGQGTDPGQCH